MLLVGILALRTLLTSENGPHAYRNRNIAERLPVGRRIRYVSRCPCNRGLKEHSIIHTSFIPYLQPSYTPAQQHHLVSTHNRLSPEESLIAPTKPLQFHCAHITHTFYRHAFSPPTTPTRRSTQGPEGDRCAAKVLLGSYRSIISLSSSYTITRTLALAATPRPQSSVVVAR